MGGREGGREGGRHTRVTGLGGGGGGQLTLVLHSLVEVTNKTGTQVHNWLT